MITQYDVLVVALNELIEINNNRIEGYRKAIEDIDGGEFRGIFQGMINDSEGFVKSLAEHVEKFDGEPASDGTLMGKIHQAWLDFKASITSHNRETILSSCEFGDKAAIEVYDTALDLDKVKASPDLENLLMSQKSSIAESLKIIQSLKSSDDNSTAEQKVLHNQ